MVGDRVTVQFEFVVGVNPGYLHDNAMQDPLAAVVAVWRNAAIACERNGGVYVTAVFTAGKVVWPDTPLRKCPPGGEDVVIVRGVRNPVHNKSRVRWRSSLNWICADVQRKLQQSTSTLTLHTVDFRYSVGC